MRYRGVPKFSHAWDMRYKGVPKFSQAWDMRYKGVPKFSQAWDMRYKGVPKFSQALHEEFPREGGGIYSDLLRYTKLLRLKMRYPLDKEVGYILSY